MFTVKYKVNILLYHTVERWSYMNYTKRLYDLRIDNDLSQQQVADYLMCNRQVYARYERGIREIPVSMLIKLAKLYNVSVDYILDLK